MKNKYIIAIIAVVSIVILIASISPGTSKKFKELIIDDELKKIDELEKSLIDYKDSIIKINEEHTSKIELISSQIEKYKDTLRIRKKFTNEKRKKLDNYDDDFDNGFELFSEIILTDKNNI